MDQPFEVGEIYENRLGLYEVTLLDPATDNMLIRYVESGEEFETSISTQERIWQNINWDNEELIRQKVKEEASYQQGYGVDFSGLVDTDFKTNTKGTTWRSRRGLAGKVAQLLSPNSGYTFVSWAIYRWPVAFLTHREDYFMAAYELGTRKAKFTIELDENNVYCGLYLERNSGPMDQIWDWTRLMPRLRNNFELQKVIETAEVDHGMRFIGRSSNGGQTFHFSDGLEKSAEPLWDEQSTKLTVSERLERFEKIPEDRWGEMYLIGTIPKQEVVDAGVRAAQKITELMRLLMPVYTAAIND